MKIQQQANIESIDEQILLVDNHISDLCVEMENSALSDSQSQGLENKIISLTSKKNKLYRERSQLENEKDVLFQELIGKNNQ